MIATAADRGAITERWSDQRTTVVVLCAAWCDTCTEFRGKLERIVSDDFLLTESDGKLGNRESMMAGYRDEAEATTNITMGLLISHAVAPNVVIAVGSMSTLTDASGAYQIAGIAPGTASVSASLTNYQTASASVTFEIVLASVLILIETPAL